MTGADLVARITGEFDIDVSQALAWLNERYGRMVAESLYRAAKKSLGNTVAGQSNYALPVDVVDIARIRIDESDGTVGLYEPTSLEQLWNIDASRSVLVGTGGLFAEDHQADGTVEVRIYPAPEQAGLAITGLQALQPVALTNTGGSTPIIPAHLHTYLLDGARSDGYDDEGRQDLAAKFEGRFEQGVEKLRRFKNTRTGPGASRVRVAGYDF